MTINKATKTIKILLIKHDSSMAAIARELGITRQAVMNRVRGAITSKRIDAAIAKHVAKSPDQINTIIKRETKNKEASGNVG